MPHACSFLSVCLHHVLPSKTLHLNKHFENPGAVGMDPVQELSAALERAGLRASR